METLPINISETKLTISSILQALDIAGIACLLIDNNGTVLEHNENAKILLNRQPENLKGISFHRLFPEQLLSKKVTETIIQSDFIKCFNAIFTDSNKIIPVKISATKNLFSEKSASLVLLEKLYFSSKSDLPTIALESTILNKITKAIAHDFRNTIGAIIATSEYMTLEIPNEYRTAMNEHLLQIISSAEEGVDLVQFLDDAVKVCAKLTYIYLDREVASLVSLLRFSMRNKLDFETQLDDSELPVLSGAGSVLRILYSLILDCASASETKRKIVLKTRKAEIASSKKILPLLNENEYICLEIADSPDIGRSSFIDDLSLGIGLLSALDEVQSFHGGIELLYEPEKINSCRIFFPIENAAV